MASASMLDMALDDIVAATKSKDDGYGSSRARVAIQKGTRGFGGRGRGRGGYKGRNQDFSQNRRDSFQYSRERRGFRGGRGRFLSEAPRRSFVVLVSGLDYTVLEEDLRELFASVGDVAKVWIDYDRTDRSKGTGGCVFKSLGDAKRALESFNGRKLEGQTMHLEMKDNYGSTTPRRGPQRGRGQQDFHDDPRDLAPW